MARAQPFRKGITEKETTRPSNFAPSTDQPANNTESAMADLNINWEDDPANPHNWPRRRKYIITILLSTFSFNTLMSSTMVAPALPQIRKELSISNDSETQLVLSIYVLAYAVGFFLWAPLSEVYGRKTILQIGNAWFCVWNLACGFARNEATIAIGRLFAGAGAASSLALGTGTMGEIWQAAQRGRSLAILSLITQLGPCVGPIIGGAIAERSDSAWRWVFWSTSIFNALLQIIAMRFLHESHAGTIQRRKAKAKTAINRKDTPCLAPRTTASILLSAMKRPFYLIFTQPASLGIVIYSGMAFGILYIVLALIPMAFNEVYQQSMAVAALNYLSFGLGTTLGAQICAPTIDWIYRRKVQQIKARTSVAADEECISDGKTRDYSAPAELRLYPFIPTIFLIAFGLVILGWSLHFRQHWIIPNVGIGLFGMGFQAMTQSTNAYIIDVFSDVSTATTTTTQASSQDANVNWVASAMASLWAAKSMGGFTFPLFAVQMIRHLGWVWSGTLLALMNLAIGLPVAILLLVYGSKLRNIGLERIKRSMAGGTK